MPRSTQYSAMSPTPMQNSPLIWPEPSPRICCCLRQVHWPTLYLSYLFSQWEMCSTLTDWFSCSIAFSTGMTCMPTPPPPGGSIGVTSSSGIWVIRLKNVARFGCCAVSSSFIIMNSALPGTKIGTLYCLCRSAFSRFISSTPTQQRWSTIFCVSSMVMLFIFASCGMSYGFLVFLKFRRKRASSFVSTSSRAQYSGSSVPIVPLYLTR